MNLRKRMKKYYYDHRTVLCKDCVFHHNAGLFRTKRGVVRKIEGCDRYGYALHDYPEDADDCEGFMTEEQYRDQQRQRALMAKRKKRDG